MQDIHFNNANWHTAASALVDSFQRLGNLEDRIDLTEKLCTELGGQLYPAFLQILYKIEQHADSEAKSLVTDTLVYALNTGRLPSGKLSAWGSSTLHAGSSFGQSRSLGPIEYLCTWYAQPTGQPPMTASSFSHLATSLLRLINSNTTARSMYCIKLAADAEDPLSGSLASQTRAGLAALASSWNAGDDPDITISKYMAALQSSSRIDQLSVTRPDG